MTRAQAWARAKSLIETATEETRTGIDGLTVLHEEHADALRLLLADSREVERLTTMLADCYRESGADPDGNEDWRLAESAVRAVKETRADAEREADELEAERHTVRKQLGDLLAVIHRDGGHYQDAHGTEKAVEDAMRVVSALHALQSPAAQEGE